MVREERPGVAVRPGDREHRAEALHKAGTILFVPDYRLSFDAPADDMLEHPRGIEAGLARHDGRIAEHAIERKS
jgi:hypothetical protein